VKEIYGLSSIHKPSDLNPCRRMKLTDLDCIILGIALIRVKFSIDNLIPNVNRTTLKTGRITLHLPNDQSVSDLKLIRLNEEEKRLKFAAIRERENN
jgi:hypothetical protein